MGLYRGVAQLASAPALGAGGRRFESFHPDQTINFLLMVKFILYLLRWQLSTPIMAPVIAYFTGSGKAFGSLEEWSATSLGNFIGAFIFFWVDRFIFKSKTVESWEKKIIGKSGRGSLSKYFGDGMRLLLYLIRWQLTTLIVAPVISYSLNSGNAGSSQEWFATSMANVVGGLVFYWVDRFIFRSKAVENWEILKYGKCYDCGRSGNVKRLVYIPGKYDRRDDPTPQYRCRKCSKVKLKKVKNKIK